MVCWMDNFFFLNAKMGRQIHFNIPWQPAQVKSICGRHCRLITETSLYQLYSGTVNTLLVDFTMQYHEIHSGNFVIGIHEPYSSNITTSFSDFCSGNNGRNVG